MKIGVKINDYIKSNGISQAFLSSKIGMNPSKLNLALNGKRKLSLSEYEYICWALGVGVDVFLEPRAPGEQKET